MVVSKCYKAHPSERYGAHQLYGNFPNLIFIITVNTHHETVKVIVLASIANTLVKGVLFAFLTRIKMSLKLIFVMLASGAAGLMTIFFI